MSGPEFEQVYREHLAFVWRALRRFGVPGAAREDVAHDVFLVVHRKLDGYDGSASMRTWIYGIARRVSANYRRKAQARARLDERMPAPPAPRLEQDRLEAHAAADLVERFVTELDEPAAELFELSEIEQWTAPEIGAALGLNVNTVYTRIRALRRAFREHVETILGKDRRASGT